MECTHIAFGETQSFAPNDLAYIQLAPFLQTFYQYPPTLASFKDAMAARAAAPMDREALVRGLREQYQAGQYPQSPLVMENVGKLLYPNTFTVTTAHQPSLFTGPLYYIYKIVSTINLSRRLKQAYPGQHFVPVFWLGAEDHDFDEIKKAHLLGKDWVWENEGQQGAVGQMSTNGIAALVDELEKAMGVGPNASHILGILRSALGRQERYGAFALDVTHQLFQDKGLVIIDPSQSSFKEIVRPIFQKELLERPSEALVLDTQAQLKAKGWMPQAFPRPVNLFHLSEGARNRMVYQDGLHRALDTHLQWDESSLLQALRQQPGQFSPNVILRPLCQEQLLPNLAYIGGGGELAYWLERKPQFEAFGIPYPILVRRDSVLWVDGKSQKRMRQLGLSAGDLWRSEDELKAKLLRQALEGRDLLLEDEKASIESIFQSVLDKASKTSPGLAHAALAHKASIVKRLKRLEHKMLMSEKGRQETMMLRLSEVKGRLFPKGKLQERAANFIPFYLAMGPAFLEGLYLHLDPLDVRVKILSDAR